MLQIGIDPGISGAIAVFDTESRQVIFHDTPTVTVKVGKKFKNQMNAPEIVEILEYLKVRGEVFVTIEKVNAMPGRKNDPHHPGQTMEASMGVTSAFNFGMGFGIWIGILSALKVPFQQVHPITWKKSVMADMSKEKDASRIKAMQLFPHTANDLKLKKHHGRADALLIAAWAMKTQAHIVKAVPQEEYEPTLF